MSQSKLRSSTSGDRKTADRRRESGIALMVAILMLVTVSALAVSTMQTAASDGTVAGFQNQQTAAFFAAEAGIAEARRVVRDMGERSQLPTYPADFPDDTAPAAVGSAVNVVSVAYGTTAPPSYFADPNVAKPIEYVGEGKACVEGCNMTLGGAKFNYTKWRINVVGQSPSGDQKRLEVVATRLLAVGY